MAVRALFPFSCNDTLTCHPPFSLVRHLSATDLRAELWVARRGPRARVSFVRQAIPEIVRWPLDRATRALGVDRTWASRPMETRFARAFEEGDAAWVYRGCSLGLTRRLRAAGHPVFLERVNTMPQTLRGIIQDAFARAGWPVEAPYTLEIPPDADEANVDAVDFVFSPSPAVTASLRSHRIPDAKILETTYGWDPARFPPCRPALPAIAGVTVLFVGGVGLRKGAHLLLDAWSRSGVEGRLVLAGGLEPLIARRCAALLARPDVVHRGFTLDLAPLYRSADIFAFPTLEEGSPLVCYEALGNGLPVITSPMGAGSVIRHGVEGLVIDPHDQGALVSALQELAGNPDRRRAIAESARRRAADYTWDKVAERRHGLFRQALSRVAGGERRGP